MEKDRGLTINFMDGSKVSYGFPDQGANTAAKQIKLEELLKQLREFRGRLPHDFKFDREEANARSSR